ncbi:hypothetical protein PVAP13_2KG269158 [Panicum virgatum]|uniref:non-specific serine/threonine protein kinase n=1 Tax=Panicum virgatum TaxID=38727 RepID=A0A8T0W3U5_PANVG|nr:hypothetical protein PVAP13_2KG269158 [Panicum virgatum]
MRCFLLKDKSSLMAAPTIKFLNLPLLIFPILLLFHRASGAGGTASDTLNNGGNITDGGTLVSAGGSFTLGFFSPAGVPTKRHLGIWFTASGVDAVCWVANRDTPLNTTSGVLVIGTGGSLLVLDGPRGQTAWSSNADYRRLRRLYGGAAARLRQPGREREEQRPPRRPLAVVRSPVRHLARRHEVRQEPDDRRGVVPHVVAREGRPGYGGLPPGHGHGPHQGPAGHRHLAWQRQDVPRGAVERPAAGSAASRTWRRTSSCLTPRWWTAPASSPTSSTPRPTRPSPASCWTRSAW